jgi:hypothetical protein
MLQFGKQVFKEEYQRNNKANGRKNIRCFPDCSENGHVCTGYCGQPVKVSLTHDPGSDQSLEVIVFAEFRKHAKPAEGFNVKIGNTYSHEDIMRYSREEGAAQERGLSPWFPATVFGSQICGSQTRSREDEGFTSFCFNQSNQGWHYAWQSHRMTRDTKHVLHAFALAGTKSSGTFAVVAEVCSPPFRLFCRRKRRVIPQKTCFQPGVQAGDSGHRKIASIASMPVFTHYSQFVNPFMAMPPLAPVCIKEPHATARLEPVCPPSELSNTSFSNSSFINLHPQKKMKLGVQEERNHPQHQPHHKQQQQFHPQQQQQHMQQQQHLVFKNTVLPTFQEFSRGVKLPLLNSLPFMSQAPLQQASVSEVAGTASNGLLTPSSAAMESVARGVGKTQKQMHQQQQGKHHEFEVDALCALVSLGSALATPC